MNIESTCGSKIHFQYLLSWEIATKKGFCALLSRSFLALQMWFNLRHVYSSHLVNK